MRTSQCAHCGAEGRYLETTNGEHLYWCATCQRIWGVPMTFVKAVACAAVEVNERGEEVGR